MPRMCALFGGFSIYLLDQHILRRGYSWFRIGGVAALSFVIGVYGTHHVQSSLRREHDQEILLAFDKRYMQYVLNSTGFGTNYLSIMDNSEESVYKKPY